MSRLEARSVTLGYDGHVVVGSQSLVLPPGRVTSLIGPNGCGKSTLLRGLSRLLVPMHGHVLLDGEDIARLPTREVARRLALLPQAPTVPEGITVAELVSRGRAPHRGLLSPWSQQDDAAVTEALSRTDTLGLADRPVDSLSGGQRQRVWLALVLAQQTSLLLLDEPTTYLDLAHQVDVLELVRTLNRGSGTTVAMVLHDLSLAARYSDHLVAICDGSIVAEGPPDKVITPQLMREVFGLHARIIADPVAGTPLVVPVGRLATDVPRGEAVA